MQHVVQHPSGTRKSHLGGGSLPLASARCAVFRYPHGGAPPRNAPKDSAPKHPAHSTQKQTLKKQLFSLLLSLLLVLLTSCNDMYDKPRPNQLPADNETSDIFILTEGLWFNNNSSLVHYSFDNAALDLDYFTTKNKRGLGDTANDMKRYGSKIYIAVNTSSRVEIIDLHSGLSLKQLPLFDQNGNARQPRSFAFHDGKAYLCSFDGTVARIDTLTLQIEAFVACGLNPDGICVANNKLYVSNSGGLNFPNYDNTVSVIDIATFTETKKITVGQNPYTIDADSEGDVYVVSRQNYGSTPYLFQKIDSKTDEVVRTFEDITVYNFTIFEDKAYTYSYHFDTQSSRFGLFDCLKETLISDNFIDPSVALLTPYSIHINPFNNDIYLSDAQLYIRAGNLLCFDKNGKFNYRLNAIGINPKAIVFKSKHE
jgi:YVTN family beta-propeller protein